MLQYHIWRFIMDENVIERDYLSNTLDLINLKLNNLKNVKNIDFKP